MMLLSVIILVVHAAVLSDGNPDAKRLYDDLLSNYNKLVRPVVNVTDAVSVKFKLKLSQLIDVNLRNQIMTTNLWVEQFWYDHKLVWAPEEFGGVNMLHVPSSHIWLPDIVLYNNADGNFEVTLATKATLYNTGMVEWKPPAIYHSSCEMDVEYFPFDEQTCVMKFGSWTYDGFQVDLSHQDADRDTDVRAKPGEKVDIQSNVVELGIDLREFYKSVEWDILSVPAARNVKFYTCCDEPYLDITFNITMRRKTLFYTVNLIIPCMGISFLTILVFYLPSDSGEKVSLSISILLSLTVFFLLLAEIIPPTSLVVPLLGKFVLFTMILDTFSICVTVIVLNVHFRSPQTHRMPPWTRRVFIHLLPRLLFMKRPQNQPQAYLPASLAAGNGRSHNGTNGMTLPVVSLPVVHYMAKEVLPILKEKRGSKHNSPVYEAWNRNYGETSSCQLHGDRNMDVDGFDDVAEDGKPPSEASKQSTASTCPLLTRAFESVGYIANCTKVDEDNNKVKEDWKYVAMVLDRLFLWIFTTAVIVGTAGIILQAPTLYDTRPAIDDQISEIEATQYKPHRENAPISSPILMQ